MLLKYKNKNENKFTLNIINFYVIFHTVMLCYFFYYFIIRITCICFIFLYFFKICILFVSNINLNNMNIKLILLMSVVCLAACNHYNVAAQPKPIHDRRSLSHSRVILDDPMYNHDLQLRRHNLASYEQVPL